MVDRLRIADRPISSLSSRVPTKSFWAETRMLALAFLTASLACSLDTSVIAGRIIATARNDTDASGATVPQIPDAFYAEVGIEQRVPFPSAVPLRIRAKTNTLALLTLTRCIPTLAGSRHHDLHRFWCPKRHGRDEAVVRLHEQAPAQGL